MDLLAPHRIGSKKGRRRRLQAEIEKVAPAVWAQKLGLSDWRTALDEAGFGPDDEITQEEFNRALAAHNEKVME